jgi:hypothetical protein
MIYVILIYFHFPWPPSIISINLVRHYKVSDIRTVHIVIALEVGKTSET